MESITALLPGWVADPTAWTSWMSNPAAWVALATLIVMEIVLGIDNLVFVSIIANRVTQGKRAFARSVGLLLAMVMRLALIGAIAWIVSLTEIVFSAIGHDFSWKDMILIGGGLFLVWKATKEIHHHVDPDPDGDMFTGKVSMGLTTAILQIFLLNIVFSVDSIITAVGMTDIVPVMIIAVVVTVLAMLVVAGPLGRFIERNPTVVMLALSFLLVIGMTLIADGIGFHVPKSYIYVVMAFSGFVELMNILTRRAKANLKANAVAQAAQQTETAPQPSQTVLPTAPIEVPMPKVEPLKVEPVPAQ